MENRGLKKLNRCFMDVYSQMYLCLYFRVGPYQDAFQPVQASSSSMKLLKEKILPSFTYPHDAAHPLCRASVYSRLQHRC